MKIALFYSYDGSKFSGSQTQPNLKAVENSVNLALNKVGIFNKIISSSRTDKGVHALNQVSSVECEEFWNERLFALQKELNKHTLGLININAIKPIKDGFHVRFDAKARAYRYIISHYQSVFLKNYTYFYEKIDLKRLNSALEHFKGIMDFKPFYKVGSNEKTTIREIYHARAYQIYKISYNKFSTKFHKQQPKFTIINFKGNGFLRSQVRLMVANALEASLSDENLEKFILNLQDKKAITKIPAPPNGLYLVRIFYNDIFNYQIN